MNNRVPIGWGLVVLALVLQVLSRGLDNDVLRLLLSGASAVLAVGGVVLVWKARRPPPRRDGAA